MSTPHGRVDTPTFMPVGTQGSVKALSPDEVAASGAQVMLANTYHLLVRPGPETVATLGGLHTFTRWPGVILTDSGGFQAYSLGTGTRTDEAGFVFKSHLDGTLVALTPERAVEVQGMLGADIQMQLDVCPPAESARAVVEQAVARTTRWAVRALATPRPAHQALFGIVQGACFADLRRAHADELGALGFDGLALGGFSVGEPPERMHETLGEVATSLDPERPRYLMGVGTPEDLLAAIGSGVDMFDCVMPTRNGRNGQAFTTRGRVVVKQARWRQDGAPLDETCSCPCCAGGFSKAFLRHSFLAGEILALRLLSLHNLHFYGDLMRRAREAIEEGRFEPWSRETRLQMAESSG